MKEDGRKEREEETKEGEPKPQGKCCMGVARVNSDLGHPNSATMGVWNTPKDALFANPTRTITQPTSSTGVKRDGPLVLTSSVTRSTSAESLTDYLHQRSKRKITNRIGCSGRSDGVT